MLLTTQDNFSKYEIVETLGLVKGNTVQYCSGTTCRERYISWFP